MQGIVAIVGIVFVSNILYTTLGNQVSFVTKNEAEAGAAYLLVILVLSALIVSVLLKLLFKGSGGHGGGHGGH